MDLREPEAIQKRWQEYTEELYKKDLHKEIGMPDHLTCLLRHLYEGQEATVRTGHETTDWIQIGKGVRQGSLTHCHSAYLTSMQSTS